MEYDVTTEQKLRSFEKLFNYRPNNLKLANMHKSDSKTRLILGGKRSGKTTFGVVECAWAGLGIHPYLSYPEPPLNIRICTTSLTSGIKGIILPMLYDWIPKHAIKKYWADDHILELVNGTLFDLKSYEMDLDKFEGVARHLVWMDEEPPKAIYQSNQLRTIAADLGMGEMGGKLLITCTPLYGMTWLYSDLYDNTEAKPPIVEHCHVTIFENPTLPLAAIEAVKKDPAMKDNLEAALYGRFFSRSGLVYPEFGDRNLMKPITEIPDDWLVVMGIDPSGGRHPHGVVFCGLTKSNIWVVFDEVLQTGTIDELVKEIQKRLGKRFPPNLVVMDTSGKAKQTISGKSIKDILEAPPYRLYIEDASKDIEAGRLTMTQLLDPGKMPDGKLMEPKLYVTENCHNLKREFRNYIWDNWTPKKADKSDPKERPLKKDDHLLDALRYVVMLNIVYRHPKMTYKPKLPQDASRVTGYF